MNPIPAATLRQAVTRDVAASIAEDEGSGDRTAALIDPARVVEAGVIVRHEAVIAGRPWVDECFRQVDPRLNVTWHCSEGERVGADAFLLTVTGPARSLLTAERIALNWLQTLSGVATRCRAYADRVAHTGTRLLDTRKTLPGLRIAQKYAVGCGGCANHRIGLYDGVLIKENHIASCGSITAAVERARQTSPDVPLEVETETEAEVAEAIAAGAHYIMLDEFPLESMARTVERYRGQARFEASGGITEDNLTAIAETGVDFISLGVLTKDVTAVDLSLRIRGDA
ncbi:MAG: carboxylating nicotinate-nucleotide diphosphorylase [Pseudomonadota bacterium]